MYNNLTKKELFVSKNAQFEAYSQGDFQNSVWFGLVDNLPSVFNLCFARSIRPSGVQCPSDVQGGGALSFLPTFHL